MVEKKELKIRFRITSFFAQKETDYNWSIIKMSSREKSIEWKKKHHVKNNIHSPPKPNDKWRFVHVHTVSLTLAHSRTLSYTHTHREKERQRHAASNTYISAYDTRFTINSMSAQCVFDIRSSSSSTSFMVSTMTDFRRFDSNTKDSAHKFHEIR